MLKSFLLIYSIVLSVQNVAQARPEYAVRHGYVSCTSCHASPFGGGQRNVNGKQYGSHGFQPGWTSQQDLVSFDGRVVALYPESPAKQGTSSGIAIMTAIGHVNVPMKFQKESKSEDSTSRFIGSYGFGGLATGLRESYALFNLANEAKPAFFKHVTVGRVNAPFGLLTDEHRTYTKLQTRTSVNNFEFGAFISGDPTYKIHYDLGVTTGFQNGGNFNSADLPYAFIGNARWNPPYMPFFIGISGSSHRTIPKDYRPYAWGAYTALSLDRMTNHFLHGSVQTEVTWARGFNENPPNDIIIYFIPTSNVAWQSYIAKSQSFGWYLLFQYDITEKFLILYKFDEFSPDSRYTADAFIRHSYGFRSVLNANMQLHGRFERSISRKPGMVETDSQATRDAVLALVQLYL